MSVDVSALLAEDDFHEYKAGSTSPSLLKDKLGKAASAFWNSGGGLLIIGADSEGHLDKGFPSRVGRQPLRDWIDQVIAEVQPTGPYTVTIYEGASIQDHVLSQDRVIAVVSFEPSHLAPHQAPDGRYYIRAGAHSVPARNFIVEALWARRHQSHPQLLHMLRPKQDRNDVLQLQVVNLSPEPALDVELTLDPLPELWKDSTNPFPLVYPVVDRGSSIQIDVATWHKADERIGPNCMLRLAYSDALGRSYTYEKPLYVKSFSPWVLGSEDRLVEALKRLEKTIQAELRGLLRSLETGSEQ
ncbi:MAG: helix-turn-helix domain-containing protein [Limnochordia bacterium]